MKDNNGAKIRSWLQTLKEALMHRVFLKILSLVLALLLWAYIIDTTPDLTRSRFVEGLSVTVTGTTTLNNNGLALATDVYSEYQSAINANVDIAQKMYSRASNENITVFLDVSNVRSAGLHEIPLTATSTHGTVTHLYPESITVMIEYIDTREVPIEVELTGSMKDNYWYSVNESSVNPQTITVSGPASVVQDASSVVAQVDITGQNASFRRAAILRMLDSNQEVITTRLLTRSSSTCSVSIDVYPTKELPVTADASQIVVEDGYEIQEITFQPPTITVAAQSALLDDLDEIPLEIPNNMAALNKTYTKRLSVSRLPEFKFMSTNQVYMTITVKEKEVTATLNNVPIDPFGLSGEYNAILYPTYVSVMVKGPADVVRQITKDDIYVYCDLSSLNPGTYSVPVFIGNNSDLKCDLITPQFIKVQITDTHRNGFTVMED